MKRGTCVPAGCFGAFIKKEPTTPIALILGFPSYGWLIQESVRILRKQEGHDWEGWTKVEESEGALTVIELSRCAAGV